MAVSNSFAGQLTRAHLASLPERSNPVHLLAVLLLRNKGYSPSAAAKMAEGKGFPPQRPVDYYERTMERYAAGMAKFHEAGVLDAHSEMGGMKRWVRSVPDMPWWSRVFQSIMWGRDFFRNMGRMAR